MSRKWSLGQALASWLEFRVATRPKTTVAAEQTTCRQLQAMLAQMGAA